MTDKISIWIKYAGALKVIGGLIFSIVVFGSSWLLRHDAKVIERQNAKMEQTTDHALINYLQYSDSLNRDNWTKLNIRLDYISDSLNNNYRQTNKMKGSIDMLATKVSSSIEEYKKIIQGAEFELVQSEVMKSLFPETKIRITKKDTLKK